MVVVGRAPQENSGQRQLCLSVMCALEPLSSFVDCLIDVVERDLRRCVWYGEFDVLRRCE